METGLYDTCRYCHFYSNGQCMHNNTMVSDMSSQYIQLVEDGLLSEVVQESLIDIPFKNLEAAINEVKPKKFAKLIREVFYKELEIIKARWEEELSHNIGALLLNNLGGDKPATIVDPSHFSCPNFM